MDLTFEVSEQERHSVHGKTVNGYFRCSPYPPRPHCKLSVGNEEIHYVDIQNENGINGPPELITDSAA
jgi:hypothetical protein